VINMSAKTTTNEINFDECRRPDNSPESNYYYYVLMSAFYVYDWIQDMGLKVNENSFFQAVKSGDIDKISRFFQSTGLVYNPVNNSISKGEEGESQYKIGNIKGVFFDYGEQPPEFESFAMYLLSGNRYRGSAASLLSLHFGSTKHLESLAISCRESKELKVTVVQVGGELLYKNGSIKEKEPFVSIHSCFSPQHLIEGGLLRKFLNYLINKQVILSENQNASTISTQIQVTRPAAPNLDDTTIEQSYSERCYSLKKISKKFLKKHLHITLFVIAAAALLVGGAVALTTYFHVGTTLMLAAGFIPFLNFVGGFQISLLLGIVTAATAGAGGVYAIIKKTKCCDECCSSEPANECDYAK
jgi:hypothetical protein